MKPITAAMMAVTALAYGATALPAGAQADYQRPKMAVRAAPKRPIAGSGTVVVQVIVNVDGTVGGAKVIRSTNPGDNEAAVQIASDSTYKPAIRNGKPSKDFYDFTIHFNGKSVAPDTSVGGSITSLIRAGKYSDAKAAAESALASSPNDMRVQQLLGVSEYFLKDYAGAAASFVKVTSIDKEFTAIAAQSLANAAAASASKDSATAVTYATRAVALDNSINSKYALGVSQIAAGQNAEGIATLKGVHDVVMTDPKATTQTKVNVDAQLLQAYLATKDTASAQAIQAEMAKLDPSGANGGVLMANHYIQAGDAASKAKQFDEAIKNYEQAAQVGGPKAAVTAYTDAAFTTMSMEKPDYKRAKAYADKALAADPNDAAAQFAEGATMAALWATGSRSDADKAAAVAQLNKADATAKAAGNTALAAQIESFLKNNIK